MSGWSLYAIIFLLPFVQEDAAVIGAATASLAGAGPVLVIFAVILAGLSASDVWKYWLGWAARRYDWAQKFSKKPGVSVAGDLVRDELVKTLFAARFVPRNAHSDLSGMWVFPNAIFAVRVLGCRIRDPLCHDYVCDVSCGRRGCWRTGEILAPDHRLNSDLSLIHI